MMDVLSNEEQNDYDDDEDLFSSVKQAPKITKSHNSDDTNEDIFMDSSEEINEKLFPTASTNNPLQNLIKTNGQADKQLFDEPVISGSQQTQFEKIYSKGGISESKSMDDKLSYSTDKTFKNQNGYSTDEENKSFINISVLEPKKLGEGMNVYVCYKIVTKTDSTDFRSGEFEVFRRFSDFLGVHEKLSDKYLRKGRIIPQPPEKNALGSTKIKMSKEEAGSTLFVEQRRATLERFLNSIAKHPYLRSDPTFVDFLEVSGELPRAASTSALSGAGVLRLIGKVGDSLSKMTYHMEENDMWFTEKNERIEVWEEILKNLHTSFDILYNQRKDLSNGNALLSRSVGALGSVEEHTGLSRALSQLADAGKNLESIYASQSEFDYFQMAEMLRDQVGYLQSIKDVFNERVKVYKLWKEEEASLNKRREAKAKLELARKFDKIPSAGQEITDCEHRVEKLHEDFDQISKTIINEVTNFEKQRFIDLKSASIAYLESLLIQEEEVIKCWENFQQEASSIS